MFYFYGTARTSTALENSNVSRKSFRSFDVNLSGHKTSHESEPTKNNIDKKMFPLLMYVLGMWIVYAPVVRAIVYRNQYWTWARTATTKSFILSTQFNFVHLFHCSFHTAVNSSSVPPFPSVCLTLTLNQQGILPTKIVCEILKCRKNEHLKMKILGTFVQAERLLSCENGRLRVHVSGIWKGGKP